MDNSLPSTLRERIAYLSSGWRTRSANADNSSWIASGDIPIPDRAACHA
ncbi:MAG TPA: hypothetical protein VJ577_11255 [Burkholderiaceae bacterium]|nr:hypothetical protein [Burkholderiaceae bacterium]